MVANDSSLTKSYIMYGTLEHLKYCVYANRMQAKKIITILILARFSGKGRHILKVLECEFSCTTCVNTVAPLFIISGLKLCFFIVSYSML